MKITYEAIGTIHTPFKQIRGMPIQPNGAAGVKGRVEMLPRYAEGLRDLEGFSHIILIYHFHRVREQRLMVLPFLDEVERGVFATRAPTRPNPVGISVVKLVKIEGNRLHIEGIDVLDQTPLLDIKPYVPAFNPEKVERVGWLSKKEDAVHAQRADRRFE